MYSKMISFSKVMYSKMISFSKVMYSQTIRSFRVTVIFGLKKIARA